MKDDNDNGTGYNDDDLWNWQWKQGKTRCHQIFAAFVQFHKANPQIWTLFERFTLEAIRANYHNYSSTTIFERIRWHVNVDTRTDEKLKLNNNFRPWYARLFNRAHPDSVGFFRNRKLISRQRPPFNTELPFEGGEPPGDEGEWNDRLDGLL